MTFATTLILVTGARISFRDRLGLTDSFGAGFGPDSRTLIKAVLMTALAVEIVGAILLFLRFRTQMPPESAAFCAVFHSVSAFCNAGFSTFSNSLEGYNGDFTVMAVMSLLIILGGLGFVVITELAGRLRKRDAHFSLHTKLCLATTGFLIVIGGVLFYVADFDSLFGRMPLSRGVMNALFQAITARTAGFNAVALNELTEVSILITMILMFIGACPGSTGGGVKTTTFALIMLLVYSKFRGRNSVSAFRRSISTVSIIRALTVFLLAILVVVGLFAVLMFAVERPLPHRLTHGWFLDNLFEMVSSFGTVGLSLGMTANLGVAGKIIIILSMFIGRVGLLTLAFALSRPLQQGEIVYGEEPVMVG